MFQPGDIVRLKTGNSPQKVVEVRWSEHTQRCDLRAVYLSAIGPDGFARHRRHGKHVELREAANRWRSVCDYDYHDMHEGEVEQREGRPGHPPEPVKIDFTINAKGIAEGIAKKSMEQILRRNEAQLKRVMEEGPEFVWKPKPPAFWGYTPTDNPWLADRAETTKETDMPAQGTLYATKDEVVKYGTYLTEDSQGRYVLEMKGGGGVEAFDKDKIEEVVPYTVELTELMTPTECRANKVHLQITKDSVSKNDVIMGLADGRLWCITQLDTKCRLASKAKGKWVKLPVEPLQLGDNEDE